MLGWGSTWGAITAAVNDARNDGLKVARLHLVHLNPLPSGLGDILRRFRTILVPEMNTGQLTAVVRAAFLVDAQCISKVQGQPFTSGELLARIRAELEVVQP
jgi:2-oxoglutarate ferredoxin oxidoreductase subunit alpha